VPIFAVYHPYLGLHCPFILLNLPSIAYICSLTPVPGTALAFLDLLGLL